MMLIWSIPNETGGNPRNHIRSIVYKPPGLALTPIDWPLACPWLSSVQLSAPFLPIQGSPRQSRARARSAVAASVLCGQRQKVRTLQSRDVKSVLSSKSFGSASRRGTSRYLLPPPPCDPHRRNEVEVAGGAGGAAGQPGLPGPRNRLPVSDRSSRDGGSSQPFVPLRR